MHARKHRGSEMVFLRNNEVSGVAAACVRGEQQEMRPHQKDGCRSHRASGHCKTFGSYSKMGSHQRAWNRKVI